MLNTNKPLFMYILMVNLYFSLNRTKYTNFFTRTRIFRPRLRNFIFDPTISILVITDYIEYKIKILFGY